MPFQVTESAAQAADDVDIRKVRSDDHHQRGTRRAAERHPRHHQAHQRMCDVVHLSICSRSKNGKRIWDNFKPPRHAAGVFTVDLQMRVAGEFDLLA